ncbi:B12-binding domain-containing radical SAM protein [Patescibacteria group bacterium]
MKILLVNPPPYNGLKVIREGRCEQRLSSFQYVMVPISLPMIAGLLEKADFNVKIYDFIVEDLNFEQSVDISAKFEPDLVIINFSTLTLRGDIKFVKQLRKRCPKAHLTAIGVHVTAKTKAVLLESELDSVIRSEPEMTALDLARSIKAKKNFAQVLGLSYKKDKEIITNADRPFIQDLDSMPFPSRHLLKNEHYLMPVYNRPYTLLITARGCPNQCTFCTARQYYGKKFRTRGADSVIKEVQEIINKNKIRDITMWADTFTFNKKFVLDFCQQVKEKKLRFKWMCNARVDTVDLEMLRAMKEAGCIGVAYGVESGVQEILNNVKKGVNLNQIERAFKLTKEADIDSLAHVIFGLPGETNQTIRQTIRFIDKIDPDYVQFYCAIPFPGTEFGDLARKKGWITTNDWSKYEINQAIIQTPLLSQKDLAKARKRAMLGFYLRWKFISRQLKNNNFKELFQIVKKGIGFLKDWGS